MLKAIKTGTLTELQVRTLNIREKELNYWTTTFSTMATMSALIAGFTYGGLTVNLPKDVSSLITVGYLAATTLSMTFALLTIIISTFCNMFGPGLALRGGEGSESVHKAIEHMKGESKKSFKFFMVSLSFFHTSCFLLMWLLYSWLVSIIINVVLLIFLVLFLQHGFEIVDQLFIPEEAAVTSKFDEFRANLGSDSPQRQALAPQINVRKISAASGGSDQARVDFTYPRTSAEGHGAAAEHLQ